MSAIPSVAMQHAIALSLGASVVRSADLIDRVMEPVSYTHLTLPTKA